MSRTCAVCGKTTVFGNKISHAHNKTRRTWKPNLHKIHALIGRTKTTIRICTRCLRSGKVVKL
jgi:large subunit ribosomal protein L28